MNLRVMGGLTGALAAVLAAGCIENPTASRAGTPSRITVDPSVLFLDEGATGNLTAVAIDELATPLPGALTFSSSAPGVASVAAAGGPRPPNDVETPVTVTALSAGPAYVRFSGQGLSDSARINVLPLTFGGALSTTTPQGGDTITIASTAVLKFDVATVTATFGGGHAPGVVSKTPDLLTLIAPFSDPAPITLTGILPTYIPGSSITLQTGSSVTQTGDFWSGDDAFATAPALPLPAAAGQSTVIVTDVTSTNNSAICPEVALGFGSSGPCMIFRFDLAADTDLNFVMDWDGSADMDFYVCPDNVPANCFEDGGGGAGSSHPEATGATFTAGTHYLVLEKFAGTNPSNIVVTIARP